jgi:hypothetical protein
MEFWLKIALMIFMELLYAVSLLLMERERYDQSKSMMLQ